MGYRNITQWHRLDALVPYAETYGLTRKQLQNVCTSNWERAEWRGHKKVEEDWIYISMGLLNAIVLDIVLTKGKS